jgi:hypothetical protein
VNDKQLENVNFCEETAVGAVQFSEFSFFVFFFFFVPRSVGGC